MADDGHAHGAAGTPGASASDGAGGAGGAGGDPLVEVDALVASIEPSGLGSLETTELRTLRRRCEEAEEAVSYARRLLQGRLDILRAEALRRDDAGEHGAGSIVAFLAEVFSAEQIQPTGPLQARATRVRVPPGADAYAARLDAIADDADLATSNDADLTDIRDLVERFSDEERELSARRRALFDRIDAIRDELAARYKDGRADISQLLSGD